MCVLLIWIIWLFSFVFASVKSLIRTELKVALSFSMALSNVTIFKILTLPNYEHKSPFHILVSFLQFLFSIFSIYCRGLLCPLLCFFSQSIVNDSMNEWIKRVMTFTCWFYNLLHFWKCILIIDGKICHQQNHPLKVLTL